jgi:hypothetical protein
MWKTPPYRFSLQRLVVVTTAMASAMAVARLLKGPELLRALVVGYLFILVTWVVLRGPYVISLFKQARRRRHELQDERRQFTVELQKKLPGQEGGQHR